MLAFLHLRHGCLLSLIAADNLSQKVMCLARAMHARLPGYGQSPGYCQSAYLTAISLMTEPQPISALQLDCGSHTVSLLQNHVQAWS